MLENYTRDFHNLIEWFKVKWAYENSAPPLRRTPLAWEVRKTSPCRMWNSMIIPKSTSPLQRSSPTESICKSPVDQIICENKPIVMDNKVNHAKEEFVHKLLKDSKNNVCKNCSSDIKEKRKNGADKTGNQIANKEKSMSSKTSNKVLVKQTVQSKTNSFVDRRLNDGITYDSKNKMDVKNISKQTKDYVHSNIVKLVDSNLSVEKREQTCRIDKNVQLSSCPNCELMQKEYNGVNVKDSKTDEKSVDSKLSYNKNNGKNEINTKVIKDSNRKCENNVNAEKLSTKTAILQNTSEKINQVDCQINKQIGDKSSTKDIQNASSNNIEKNPVIISTDKPAYSTVSQTKRSKEQSSISSETPKFVRSKTCLSDKNLPASSKRRPGTSVIVRGRFQTPENKVCMCIYIYILLIQYLLNYYIVFKIMDIVKVDFNFENLSKIYAYIFVFY